jgi:hypothetical protein
MFREITAVYFQNLREHINTMCEQSAEFVGLKKMGPAFTIPIVLNG